MYRSYRGHIGLNKGNIEFIIQVILRSYRGDNRGHIMVCLYVRSNRDHIEVLIKVI